jgi:hypothetical protein
MVYRMLKDNDVKMDHYHFEHKRFDALRKNVYKKKGRVHKPTPAYSSKDKQLDWWMV